MAVERLIMEAVAFYLEDSDYYTVDRIFEAPVLVVYIPLQTTWHSIGNLIFMYDMFRAQCCVAESPDYVDIEYADPRSLDILIEKLEKWKDL